MIELTFHKVYWCARHGHPALALQVAGSDRCLVLALGNEDALALAAAQQPGVFGSSRLYALLENGLLECGGRFTALQFTIGPDAVVRAFLHLEGSRGSTLLPAHIADAMALALRADLPLWMSDDDLARVAATTATFTEPEPPAPSPPEPFRRLVETLDLEGFAGPAQGR